MLSNYFSLVKFSHTVFALPFAFIGFRIGWLENGSLPSMYLLLFVIVCMITARNAAMAFNRYLDRDIDALNPRTIIREIPAGKVKPKNALIFVVINSIIFVLSSSLLNPLCGILSPVALLVILGYSYTKRFTPLCHLVLGLGLALAPIGAAMAISKGFDLGSFLIGVAVFFWVSGFDIIYALQDQKFDKENHLNSIPVLLGTKNAILLSRILHAISSLAMILGFLYLSNKFHNFGFLYLMGTISFIGFLIFQHTQVRENDLSRINLAFFTSNGLASMSLGILFLLDSFI
jgi:4-hydroxybenzoate polyprenyltransferase